MMTTIDETLRAIDLIATQELCCLHGGEKMRYATLQKIRDMARESLSAFDALGVE